jgi:hypothetical protein
VPVINGLTDLSHPCQIIADIMTIEEWLGDIAGKTIAWLGDGNNVCTSFIHAAEKLDFKLRIATPANYAPRAQEVAAAKAAGADVEAWARCASGDRRRRCRRHRHLGVDGRHRQRRAHGRVPALRGQRRMMARAQATRSSCTACPRTAARKSPQRCSTARNRRLGRSGKPHPRAKGRAALVLGQAL